MPVISQKRRLVIAAVGYGVVTLFAGVLLFLRHYYPALASTERIIFSGLAVAPLVLALLWEHLKGFKIGEIEITLAEVTPHVDFDLAANFQELQGSGTPALVQAISGAVARKDLNLLAVNLRSAPYWWSTRLYLLAALASEYTNIERLIFVEGDAARIYIGMASPGAVRRALARRFAYLESTFQQVQRNCRTGASSLEQEISNFGYQWPGQQFEIQPPTYKEKCPRCNAYGVETHLVPEQEARQLVQAAQLREWLGSVMETEYREWDGKPASQELYARIMTCDSAYVPLLFFGIRLERVVSRRDLAQRLALSSLGSPD